MNRTERLYKIEQMLQGRRVVPIAVFLEVLEVSRATFKRDMEYLRDRMHAPIEWDREAGGYRFTAAGGAQTRHELPGLWFNASEVHALLTMQHLLRSLDPGVLAPHVAPLLERLQSLLESGDAPQAEIERRIRIIRSAARSMKVECFALAAHATLRRARLRIEYRSRYNDGLTERVVSPQRLVFYRSNWYLDAWCHLREDIRSFALDGVRRAELLDERARNVPERELDEYLSSGYGIFAGRRVEWARLRFSEKVKRWVAAERWHSRQRGAEAADGSYLLEVPYNEPQELVMDVLRWGAEVEVLAPPALRERVAGELRRAAGRYGARTAGRTKTAKEKA